MTVSSGYPAAAKEPSNAVEPLVDSVRSFLTNEPQKLLVKVISSEEIETSKISNDIPVIINDSCLKNDHDKNELKRNDLNNNSKNKISSQKNNLEETTLEKEKTVDAPAMPSASERMQRQPLLACPIKQESRITLPIGDVDHDQNDRNDPSNAHGQQNGDFVIEIPPGNREERYPKEVWKTIVSFLFLFGCVLINMLSLSLTHEKVPDRDVYGPLPDVFLDNVPEVNWALTASEYLIMISTTTATCVIVFHKHRFIVARRMFFIIGLLYLYRSLTMYVTVLPISNKTYFCSPKSNHTTPLMIFERMVYLLSGFGLTINGKHIYCGDSIYSGHTMILVMSYLIICEYSPKRGIALHWAAGAAALAGILLVLLGHSHYMIDVVIAYYITTRLFWTYHTLACKSPRQASSGMISREWWMFIFNYFEKNIRGPLPRQYNWPLPWPKAKLFSRLS